MKFFIDIEGLPSPFHFEIEAETAHEAMRVATVWLTGYNDCHEAISQRRLPLQVTDLTRKPRRKREYRRLG